MRQLRFLIVPLLVVPIGWLLLTGFSRDPREVASPLVGNPAPAWQATTLDGDRLSSADLAGRPYVVNFWASWCIPACVDEHPVLADAWDAHSDSVTIVGVVYQDGADAARDFLARLGDAGYPHLLDPDGMVAVDFGVTGPPETFFVDAGGIVRAKQFGPLTDALMAERLGSILPTAFSPTAFLPTASAGRAPAGGEAGPMKRWVPAVALGAVFALLAVTVILAIRPGTPPTDAQRAAALAAELRCPDCQGLSVADSPTTAAREIRRQVDALLAGGASDDEVRAHFTARYGEWILLAPSAAVVWAVPFVAVGLGVVALGWWLASNRRREEPAAVRVGSTISDDERRRLHDEAEGLDG